MTGARRATRPPSPFRIERRIAAGRHRLLEVFPGLDATPAFARYPLSETERRTLARRVAVEVVRAPGEWMYVAPHRLPKEANERWQPIVTRRDLIAVGQSHLRRSPSIVLYLDILHELVHILQRRAGRELWDPQLDYVDRPTEIEAYRFAVEEARRLGVDDRFLRDYLVVAWVSPSDHRRLLRRVGVRSAPRRRSRGRTGRPGAKPKKRRRE